MLKNIYLSYQRDPDLVALYKQVGKKQFMQLLKESLRVLIRSGYVPKYKLPIDFMLQPLTDVTEQSEYIRICVSLTSYKDEDIAQMMTHVSERKSGLFIKSALRFYIGPVLCLQGFLDIEFQKYLINTCRFTQVFSFGSMIEENDTKKQKKQRKPRKPRVQKSNTTSNKKNKVENSPIPKITEQEKPNQFGFPTMSTPVKAESLNKPDENANEEDEMLSLLEGLLG